MGIIKSIVSNVRSIPFSSWKILFILSSIYAIVACAETLFLRSPILLSKLQKRPRSKMMDNIPQYRRKEQSIYKPTGIEWMSLCQLRELSLLVVQH
jgi:hypothetical protein